MKFGQEFVWQMIPEWQEAYMNYAFLKTLLKGIQVSRQGSRTQLNSKAVLRRKLSLYRAFSGLTQRHSHSPSSSSSMVDSENQAILVNVVTQDGFETCETTFLKAAEAGGESELVFFKTLDREFNKVNRFYQSKAEEMMKEAVALTKQMDALIAFRSKVDKPLLFRNLSEEISVDMNILASEVAGSAPSSCEKSEDDHRGKECISSQNQRVVFNQRSKGFRRARPAPLNVLGQIKINNTLETPLSTIRNVFKVPKQEELKFTRENLKKIEERLKQVFVEFYHKLRLVKKYSFLNTLAFSKIMKKYDKITSRDAAKAYLEMVDASYLSSSDEINKLMLRVESTFVKHFANANRSKGMSILRTKTKKERHRITFSAGFFAGCTVSLIIALALIIHARNVMGSLGQKLYMETMFPLYSLFGFAVLHMIMYAADIYFWRRYRVNYPFIFGFKEGTELGYRQVLLLSFCLGALSLSSVLLNLDMEMNKKTNDYKTITELLPLFVVILVLAILLCPFNVLYRTSRVIFLTSLFHCIAAPLYAVNLPDFFLADQLTSQVQALRSLEFYVCYYGWGDFRLRQNTCRSNNVYRTFYFTVAVVPYWSRLLQCFRRLLEGSDSKHGYNALKYFLTIVAICLRTAYSLHKGRIWKITAWVFSAIATFYGTYWDIVFDWGLLQRQCRNSWLRERLLVPHKSVYYAAVVLNVMLRFAWLQTVLDFKFSFLHRETMIALFASLEIIRRGIWNFFRLENEHLNNVGRFRAFKSVPLPFNYEEDEDKDN